MKLNWKVRFKNKAFLTTFLITVIAFIYQILGLFGVVPKISEDQLTSLVMLVVNMLVALGIVVDPTTKGIPDSKRALTYEDPQ